MHPVFDITPEELPIFLAEAGEQIQILDEGLVRLEHEEAGADLLKALFRAAHTLKGSAGMVGHQRMVTLTHALEAALDGLRKGSLQVSVELIDTCLSAVDALRLLCAEVSGSGTGEVEIESLVSRFSVDKKPLAIRASISPDSIASAARAFQIMLALQEMGEILQMEPSQQQIETANPVYVFAAQFIPSRPIDENTLGAIYRSLSSISEIERLVIGEREYDLVQPAEETPQVNQPEEEFSRLGETLLKNGLISAAQLEAAFRSQTRKEGPRPLLGQALIEMGAIDQETLDQVIAEQKVARQAAFQEGELLSSARPRQRAVEKTVRTNVERLDNLMNLMGELITDRNRLNLVRSKLEEHFPGDERVEALGSTITHLGRITDQLQAEVMGIRMLPISNIFNKLPRMVRDLSRKAGKQVDLVMRGEDTELDRSVIEELADPLIHLLRNAVDHGIESPEERLAAGKPERGLILITARHEQGRIVVTLEDNGHGVDLKAVRAKAVERGYCTQAEAETLSDEEAVDLIFLSGLSTARVVSDVSGRGVGMDIVRSNIERLNGSVLVETWPGQGTRFQIFLPLTLAIVPTLLVRLGAATYAIPLVTVTETLRIPQSGIQTINGRPVVLFREGILPLARLSEVFELLPSSNGHARGQYEYVVVVRSGKLQMGLVVDSLVGEQEVVVKSLSSVVGEITGVSSAAILGDGQVALIVDVQGLFRLAGQHPAQTGRPQ